MKKWLIILCCLFCLVGKGQIITTVAGSGAATYSGNSSPATAAGIPDPIGGIFDQYGNYYFADAVGSCRIRKIDATGIITTIAGNGTPAFSGDNGPATMAALNLPCAVKLDTAGNVFIVDANNYRIRKVDAVTGIITTVAGTGAHAFGGDSGPATAAALNGPNDICFDKQGNLYIADLSNYRIRKINTAGIITTIAGNGTFGSTGDGGPATAAQISGSPGLAIDNSGNIYIAERGGNRVRKVNTAGIITTFAGNGVAAYLGDGIPATNAQISPGKVYFDTMTDQLYIADDYNERIFVVDGSGIIRHIGGNGTNGFSGDGGPAKAAQLDSYTRVFFVILVAMNAWSIKRKRIVLLVAVLIFVILLGVPLFFFFNHAPTCSDGKQNGDETGVDCGGSCALLCPDDSLPMITNGDPQILQVTPSTYDVVAYVQNPNVSGKVLNASYTFNIYSASSTIALKTITGTTFIPHNSSFAVFVGPISSAGAIPTHATFAWGALAWQKDTSATPALQVNAIVLSGAQSSPRIDAELENDSLGTVSNIEAAVLIFDQNKNIIAASKTVVDSIEAGQSAPLVFTWPTAFSSATTTIEILPRVFPDTSYIQ